MVLSSKQRSYQQLQSCKNTLHIYRSNDVNTAGMISIWNRHNFWRVHGAKKQRGRRPFEPDVRLSRAHTHTEREKKKEFTATGSLRKTSDQISRGINRYVNNPVAAALVTHRSYHMGHVHPVVRAAPNFIFHSQLFGQPLNNLNRGWLIPCQMFPLRSGKSRRYIKKTTSSRRADCL